jgi:hypothetical protein
MLQILFGNDNFISKLLNEVFNALNLLWRAIVSENDDSIFRAHGVNVLSSVRFFSTCSKIFLSNYVTVSSQKSVINRVSNPLNFIQKPKTAISIKYMMHLLESELSKFCPFSCCQWAKLIVSLFARFKCKNI